MTCCAVKTKHPAESDQFTFTFTERLRPGESITAVDPATSFTPETGANSLVYSAPAIADGLVTYTFAGGTYGQRYTLTLVVTTSQGRTLVCCGILDILACC